MAVTQVSVFLENKPGHLEKALAVLAESSINIIALVIAEASGFGLVRMIVDKPADAAAALKKHGITCSETPVLAVEIADTPGSLLAALRGFRERNLNIEYMYTFAEKKPSDRVVVIFRFEDSQPAQQVLVDDGYRLLTHRDIIGA